jgi:hypothetical protein
MIKIFNKPYFTDSKQYGKCYNFFWDDLTYNLSKKYHIKEYKNVKDFYDNSKINNIETLEDCDYLVLDTETESFIIFSVSDVLNYYLVNFLKNNNLKKVFFAQYFRDNILANSRDNYKIFSPWLYFPSSPVNLDQYFLKRKYKNNFINKLFFKGEKSSRPIIEYFSKNIMSDSNRLSLDNYLDEAIDYKIGLSVGGVGEFCYRDIEYMALGIPFIRFEYQSSMLHPLIPNYHYISIKMPSDMPINCNKDNMFDDKNGLYHHAKALENKFLETVDNAEFLNFISRNARNYYENFLSPKSSVKITIQLIEKELFN